MDIKIEYEQLRLLGTVTTTDGTYEFLLVTLHPPHHTTTTTAFQLDQITNELPVSHVPQFHRPVI